MSCVYAMHLKLLLKHFFPADVSIINCACQVLIGVGKLLRLYDLGRKKLLRKCENKHIPHAVVDIKTIGERIIVSDIQVNNQHTDFPTS